MQPPFSPKLLGVSLKLKLTSRDEFKRKLQLTTYGIGELSLSFLSLSADLSMSADFSTTVGLLVLLVGEVDVISTSVHFSDDGLLSSESHQKLNTTQINSIIVQFFFQK